MSFYKIPEPPWRQLHLEDLYKGDTVDIENHVALR